MKITYKNIQFVAVRGDIANQPDIDAVVNAANAQLATGGGVAGAIHKAAGPQLYEACKPLAPVKPGEAVITDAFELPNDFVIHCHGPVYGKDQHEDVLLANCYKNALKLANEHTIRSIAFPSISTGAFGYPIEEATKIALYTILQEVEGLKHLQKIKFVLYSEHDLDMYRKHLKDLS